MRLLLCLVGVGTSAMAAGCGGSGAGSAAATYIGHSRQADLTLSVAVKKPHTTAWKLSVRFTSAGAALKRRLPGGPDQRDPIMNVFCVPAPRTAKLGMVEAGIGPGDLQNDVLNVPRLMNLPAPDRWICGLEGGASAAKNLRDYIARAPLSVTLRRR